MMVPTAPEVTSEVTSNAGEAALGQASAAASGEGAPASSFWLFCRAGSHRFALPVSQVIETMRPLPIESVAGTPPLVCGLCIIRGVPVPVVDASLLFNDRPCRRKRLITVRTGTRTIAFAADDVLGVHSIRTQVLERLPPLLRNAETIAAIANLDAELMFFLDTARIIPDEFLDCGDADGEAA